MEIDKSEANNESMLKHEWNTFLTQKRKAGTGREDPAFVFPWTDPKGTGAIGWVVIDRAINQVSGGGIFCHANATLEETADIAFNMSRKFTVTDPQIGGAKAGIRFDHRDPRAKEVLRRFIQDNEKLLRTCWVTAGDLNTDDRFIEEVIQSMGLTTCQSLLAHRISEKTGSADRSAQLSALINAPASPFFPLIEGAVGYGLAASIDCAIRFCANIPSGTNIYEKLTTPVRIAIQGFGAVGSSLSYYCGSSIVTALADKDGFIVNPNGINIQELLMGRASRLKKELAGAPESVRTECAKNFICNLPPGTSYSARTEARTPEGDQAFLIRFLKSCDAEVISLCAGRYQLTKEVVSQGLLQGAWSGGGVVDGHKRRSTRFRILACGANNPYGLLKEDGSLVEDKMYSVANYLIKHGTCIVPDWVANSGTAQLFHRALSSDFDRSAPPHVLAESVLESCAAPIRTFLKTAFTTYAHRIPTYLLLGAEKLARERLVNPLKLGGPGRDSFSNPARSIYALPPLPVEKRLPLEERVRLFRSMMAEVIDCEGETLENLLQETDAPVAYDGFEPSGRMHVAQGILKSIIVNRLTRAGGTFLFWIADIFALMNHKMGSDLEAIKLVGKYMIEVWKSAGMDMSRVRFLWASEEFDKRHTQYWSLVIELASKYRIPRVKRCTTIMGREDEDDMPVSHLLYPLMQCADIFFLGVDVAQLGLDQRKVNVLAREYADSVEGKAREYRKPIVLSHPMIMGLKVSQAKMSKSDPDSAIFMEDSEEEVVRKVRSAFCPPLVIENNPTLNYFQHIVFPKEEDDGRLPLLVGSNLYDSYTTFEEAFRVGTLHPNDIKLVLVERLNAYIKPVRDHFVSNPEANSLLERVRNLTKKYNTTTLSTAPLSTNPGADEVEK